MKRIPVILDTDIGTDIDDTWALIHLLKCPELDVRLVVSDHGDTVYRAKLLARLLTIAGRTDIPVGVGIPQVRNVPYPQAPWVEDYRLEEYPGEILRDGVQTIIDTCMKSDEVVTLICIGPVPNIGEALRRCPELPRRTRFVGMHGSIRKGFNESPQPVAEYNVVCDVAAARAVFAADWRDIVITPLDTCGSVRLTGELYRRIAASRDPLLMALMDNYRIWCKHPQFPGHDADTHSSILYDTVAVHLAYSTDYLTVETMGLSVRDDGFTVPDPHAHKIRVATDWIDLNGYHEYLTTRLESPVTIP